jgi:ketosteroid isomerase-like protein
MNTRTGWLSIAALLLMLHHGTGARAADPELHAEDRKQLLNLMHEVEAAINEQNIDRMLTQFDDNATVTWLNAEVSRGKPEIKAYYQRMVGGEHAILKKYLTKAKLAAPARFYGDIAVADGSTADEFFPWKRGVFRFDSRWSGTMAKIDGQWKLVALHLSTNVFTNPLIAEYEQMLWYVGIGAFAAGLLLAFLAFKFLRRG